MDDHDLVFYYILFNNLWYYGDFWDPSALRKPPNHRSYCVPHRQKPMGGAEVPIVPPARKFAEAFSGSLPFWWCTMLYKPFFLDCT